jgi:hypothetical protein
MKHIKTEGQKHMEEFTLYQLAWLKDLEDTIRYGNKTFKKFSVDKTQIPCLLIMNMASFLKMNLNKEEYNSFKHFAHDILEGNMPKRKPYLEVIK